MKHKRQGFTFIEVMIAVVLLTVGVFALINAMVTSYGSSDLSRNFAIANLAAANAVETLKEFAARDLDGDGQGGDGFGVLYQNYQTYSGPNSPFFVLPTGQLVFANTAPPDAVGIGWFEFVTQETNVQPMAPNLDVEWGVDVFLSSNAAQTNLYGIDLSGDGDVVNGDGSAEQCILGRTAGTVAGVGDNADYYMFLPVKVVVVMYGGSRGSGFVVDGVAYNVPNAGAVVVRKTWILNPY